MNSFFFNLLILFYFMFYFIIVYFGNFRGGKNRGSVDPVHDRGSMAPVHISVDPVHGRGPWTPGPCFVLSPNSQIPIVICCIHLNIHHISRILFLILSFLDFVAFVVKTLISP